MLGPNSVIAKDVKSCTYCCYVLCGILNVRVCTNHCHAKLGISDKGRAIKGLVVFYAVWIGSMGWVFGPEQGTWFYCGQDGYRSQVCKPHRYMQIQPYIIH